MTPTNVLDVWLKSSLHRRVLVADSQQQRCGNTAVCAEGQALSFSMWTLGGKLSTLFPCSIMWGGSKKEAVGSWKCGFIASHEGMGGREGKVMIIWFSSPLILTRTLAHTVSLFHLFSRYHFSLRGSCCQFLPRLIIALLVSPCNGPILSNPEHWASALPMTKDYFIDSSLSLPVPSLCLTVLFLHSFMSSSNFLTLILFPTNGFTWPDAVQSRVPWATSLLPIAWFVLSMAANQSTKDLWFLCSGGTISLQTISNHFFMFQYRWWSTYTYCKIQRLR